jgi:hypothetical protein
MAAAIQVSRHHLARLAQHGQRLQQRLHNVSRKAEHAFDVGISAGLAVGTAGALGFVHGRHGAIEVAGVPLELAAGIAGTGAALFGLGGKHADKVGAVGASMLGVYAYNTAKGAGLKMKKSAEDAALKAGTKTTGRLPQDALRPEEVATMDRPTDAERRA